MIAIPQFIPEDRASGAQLIGNSLNFNATSKTYLQRTPSSGGNQKTFTVSVWVKRGLTGTYSAIINAASSTSNRSRIFFDSDDKLGFFSVVSGTKHEDEIPPERFRDVSGWYHIVYSIDCANTTATIYVNGENVDTFTATNQNTLFNSTTTHYIGGLIYADGFYYVGSMSQFYMIDGQALTPSYFGYTDGLTGTWRPKKFNITDAPTADWGTNGFYLPFDGSAPIGNDQSGNGNNWSPRNIASGDLNIATGALPTLNTVAGGNVAAPRARGNAGVAVTVYDDGGGNKYYLDGVKTGSLDFVRGQTVTFDTGDSTVSGHPFRFSGVANGSHNAMYSVDFDGTGDYLTAGSSSDFTMGTGDFTVECWIKKDALSHRGIWQISDTSGGLKTSNYKLTLALGMKTNQWQIYGANLQTEPTYVYTADRWYHTAYVRNSGVSKLYIDGEEIISQADTTDYDGTYIAIGGYYSTSYLHNGEISDFRVVKGTAVYTSSFTPPPEPLTNITNTKLLCCNQSTTTGSTVTPGTITANGDPTASNENPYDTYLYATVTGAISPGTVGAATTITFPHNAPDSLYYYCTNHSGMGGSGTIGLSTDIRKADLYGWKNTLAVSGSVIADDSNKVNCTTTTKALTTNGNTALTSTRSNFYARSIYFDGSGDYIAVASSADCSAMRTEDFCFEAWVYMINLSNRGTWFDTRASNNTTGLTFGHETDGSVRVYLNASSGGDITVQQSTPCKIKTWYHMAVTRESGTVRLFINGQNVSAGTNAGDMDNTNAVNIGYRTYTSSSYDYFTGYMNEARIYKGAAKYTSNFIPASTQPDIIKDSPSGTVYDSALEKPVSGAVSLYTGSYLSLASSSDFTFGTNDFTYECWIYPLSCSQDVGIPDPRPSSTNNISCMFGFNSSLQLFIYVNGSLTISPSATTGMAARTWQHVTYSRSGSTGKMFINGKQVASVSDSNNYIQSPMAYGWHAFQGATFTGVISNARIVKGTGLYTQDFVPSTKPLTNVTNTKLLFCNDENFATSATVTPGTITASGSKSLPSSFSPFDTSIDEVLGKGSDYCIWNNNDNSAGTISRGGFYWVSGSPGNVTGTIGMPLNSGKYYWEYTLAGGSSSGVYGIGYGSVAKQTALANLAGAGVKIYGYSPNGSKYENDSATSYGPTIAIGDTLSVLFDSYKRELVFWHNGVSQGVAYTVAVPDRGADYIPMIHGNDNGSGPAEVRANWGQQPFKYKPPEGYKTLNTKNLPVSITRSDQYVGIVTYTGNSATRNITDLNFQPDLVWIKDRDAAYNYVLQDSVRGAGSTTKLASNLQSIQGAGDNELAWSGYVSSFNKEGFTVDKSGSGAIDWANVNKSSDKYVAWCWKAGGNKNTFNVDDVGYSSWAATGISGGDITPSGASINTKAGFSIIKWIATTEATPNIPHGLGKLPKFWLIKNISGSSRDWIAYTTVVDGTLDFMHLNNQEVIGNSSADAPTTTTFGTYGNDINTNGETLISYVWTEIPGYSKFGTFEGNGDSSGTNVTWDGPFVYTGFRPALVIIKSVDSENDWNVQDDVRMSYNAKTGVVLQWNATSSESTIGTGYSRSYFADGFKITNSNHETNKPSETFLYAAWAKNPFGNLYGGQANAR